MKTVSEEICGEYLRCILKCDFIQYNVNNPDIQGEIDVIGINLNEKKIYVCEVAAHIHGLQYVKNKKPDDYNRFYEKFHKSINYVKKYFSDYNLIVPMIWSPIVRISGETANYNTYIELKRLKRTIDNEFDVDLELVINDQFESSINTLRSYASNQSAHFSSRLMRLFQIEAYLKNHVTKYKKKGLIKE